VDECSGNEHFTLNTIPAGQINYKIIILKSSTLQRACRIFYFMNTLFANHIHVEKPRDFDPFGQAGFAHLWLQYD